MKNVLLIAILSISQSLWSSETFLIPIGKTEILPFKPHSVVHVSNGKILKLREQSGRIYATGVSKGEVTLTNQAKKYRVFVLDEQDINSYHEILSLVNSMRGLKVEILNNQTYVVGELLRFNDWQKITELSKEKNLRWVLKAKASDEFQKSILDEASDFIRSSSLPLPSLSATPTLLTIISNLQEGQKQKYRELLEPMGFKIVEDKNALQLEPMVDLKVRMVELKKNSFRKLGIDLPQSYTAQVLPSNGFKVSGNPFDVALNALEQDGSAKIIASPHLSCRSGKEAKFLAGGEFPIKIMNFQTNEIQWKKHGILLTFKPLADRSGKMSIALDAEISMLDQAQTIDGVPGLLVNRVQSHLDLERSQTIAISGLIKEHIGKSTQGLTLLKNLPVLGLLFSSEDYRQDRTDLVVFVTPQVLNN